MRTALPKLKQPGDDALGSNLFTSRGLLLPSIGLEVTASIWHCEINRITPLGRRHSPFPVLLHIPTQKRPGLI
jgi:hypothetical protein